MTPQLALCPHCGSDRLMTLAQGQRYFPMFAISCVECGGGGGEKDTLKQAIDAWNMRADKSGLIDLEPCLGVSVVVYHLLAKVPTAKLIAELQQREDA